MATAEVVNDRIMDADFVQSTRAARTEAADVDNATPSPAALHEEVTATDSAAAKKVFNVPELLEHILLQLPTQDIILAQRVNKFFYATINGSLPLRRALFLEPPSGPTTNGPLGWGMDDKVSQQDATATVVNDLVIASYAHGAPQYIITTQWITRTEGEPWTLHIDVDFKDVHPSFFLECASWRKMYPSRTSDDQLGRLELQVGAATMALWRSGICYEAGLHPGGREEQGAPAQPDNQEKPFDCGGLRRLGSRWRYSGLIQRRSVEESA